MSTRSHVVRPALPGQPVERTLASSEPAESRTRARILEVAEATFAEVGYHGARLHEIARRAGLRKASLFHYFTSKEHLYRAVVDRSASETEHGLYRILGASGEPRAKVEELLATYVDIVAAHPNRIRILLRQSLDDDSPAVAQGPEARQLLQSLLEFIAAGQRSRIFLAIDAEALLLGLIGMVAFLFTSAAALAPGWPQAVDAATVERIKRHVIEVARRCLIPDGGDRAARGAAVDPLPHASWRGGGARVREHHRRERNRGGA